MHDLLSIFFAAGIVNNFVLTKFLGICPFLGVSTKTKSAFSMGLAVTFVMFFSAFFTYIINTYVLEVFNIQFLTYATFILVIASFVQLVEMFMKKYLPALYESFGIYLPLITTNCAILGLVLLNRINGFNMVEGLVYALGGGFGFTLAIVLMSGIRERLDLADIPEAFKGVPIALITAGILAIAFMGFTGMMG